MTETNTDAPRTAVRWRVPVTGRWLRIGLGVLWLADGALQLQLFMFGHGFADQVLTPAGINQPGWVAGGVNWAVGLVGAHPAVWNSLFATIQLVIGAGLLYRPLARVSLVASVGWALAVWYYGEGLGGLASGHATLLTGAPGAVLLYAVLAAVAWPARAADAPAGWRGWLHPDDSAPPAVWTPVAWAVVWLGGAVLQALPGQNTPDTLADTLSGGVMPAWLMPLDNALANGVRQLGTPVIWVLVAVLVAVGLGGLAGPRLRAVAGWAGVLLAAVFWVVGEGFGNLGSGQATDPNTGPLLALLALALLGTVPAEVTEPALRPAWRVSALSGVTAAAVLGVGVLLWATTQPGPPQPPAHLTLTGVYTPAGSAPDAPVYLTVTNTGDGPDTLTSAGTEFQTAGMAKGVTVCADQSCSASTVVIPAHSTVVFGPAGPHLAVRGLGSLAAGHQPLQLTLTFARSGMVHVLSPVGSAANLSQQDVMTYGYMGHRDPGMGMSGDMSGMAGMDMPGHGGG